MGRGDDDRETGLAGERGSLGEVAELIAAADRIFVLAGAGMSTESGIPDFRGPDGLWTRHPEAQRMFELDAYRSDPELRKAAWQVRLDTGIIGAEPNAGHRAVDEWGAGGKSVTVATQNIDGLQQRAGNHTEVLELHGTFWKTRCLSCGETRPMSEVSERLDAGEPDPDCRSCGGILKSATVSFGEYLDPDVLAAASAAAESCDLALAIGSSLTVEPAASLCSVATGGSFHGGAGGPLVILNAQPTGYDGAASVVIRDRIGPTLEAINELVSELG